MPTATTSRSWGQLSFGWILGGRAIQDVWRVPIDAGDAPSMRGFYGTTVRFYDPAIAAWRSTWLDLLNGRVLRFIGRPVPDGIELTGLDDDPKERWSFRDITRDSFRWTGEMSRDGGRTREQYEEMRARRRVRGAAPAARASSPTPPLSSTRPMSANAIPASWEASATTCVTSTSPGRA